MATVDRTAPPGAPSRSPAAERRSRHPARAPSVQSSTVDSDCAPQDRTDARIRAFLASMRPLRGSTGARGDDYQRGRDLIENLAASAEGDASPVLRFTRSDCADVVSFLMFSEPVAKRDWWNDDSDEPSPVVGYHFVLGAVQDSLQAEDTSPEAAQAPTSEFLLLERVENQRDRLFCVLGSVRCIAQAVQSDAAPDEDELAGALELAAEELQRALDELERERLTRAVKEDAKGVEELRAASELRIESK